MARYLTFVFISNMVAVLFYKKINRIDLEKKTFLYITGISLLMSLIFPILLIKLTIVQIIFLYFPMAILASLALYLYDRPEPESVIEPTVDDAGLRDISNQLLRVESNEGSQHDEQIAIAMHEDSVEEKEHLFEAIQDSAESEVVKEEVELKITEQLSESPEGSTESEVVEEEVELKITEQLSESPEGSTESEVVEEEAELKITEQLSESPEDSTESEVTEEDAETIAAEEKSIELAPMDCKEEISTDDSTHESEGLSSPIAFLLNKGEKMMEESIDLLESCIDKGFDAKLRGEVEEALDFFIKAIRMSPSFEVMTFLVLDISTMYKELGRYDEAIGILETFLTISAKKMTDSLRRDITTNIEYLRIIKELLKKANTPNLPISRVPKIIKAAADKRLEQLELT